jgi:integrase
LREASLLDYRGDLEQFIAILGDLPVTALSHEVLNECKDKLTRLPRNINKDPTLRGKSIDAILALALPAQASQTVKKKWQRLVTLLDWAVNHGVLPVNNAKNKTPRATVQSYEKFTRADLKALFECAHYQEHQYAEAFQYWLPVLGLYTGARIEELAQLHVNDLRQDEATGIWCLHITAEVDGEGGYDQKKRLKTAASRRVVPIHGRLTELGLLSYAQGLRERGYQRLFPELAPDAMGRVSGRATEWFTQFRRGCGVGTSKGRSSKVFHSFRHTANAALQAANVAQEIREALVGHSSRAVNVQVYGATLPLKTLAESLGNLSFEVGLEAFKNQDRHEIARRRAPRLRGRSQE